MSYYIIESRKLVNDLPMSYFKVSWNQEELCREDNKVTFIFKLLLIIINLF